MNDVQNAIHSVRNELGKQLMAELNGVNSNDVADAILSPTNKLRRLSRMVRTANKLVQQIESFKHSAD